jgi:hypothetical protein
MILGRFLTVIGQIMQGMDLTSDMPEQQDAGDDTAVLGPSARAFGKAALVAYWIACLAVIVFGLAKLGWLQPPAKVEPPAAATRTVAPARPPAPRVANLPARAAQPARPVADRPSAEEALTPLPWVAALILLSIGGLLTLLMLGRRRGSRDFGRFSGRRHRLGSMGGRIGRSWGL